MTDVARPLPAARTPAPGQFGEMGVDARHAAGPDYAAIADSAAFAALRTRFRRYVFPMAGLFLAWYLTYVLLAAYAPGVMGTRLTGSVTVGLVLGVLQFVSTIAITWAYVRYARRAIDPRVREIRQEAGIDRS
jgi:uncharacterized membrane protein (DUF485 family)